MPEKLEITKMIPSPNMQGTIGTQLSCKTIKTTIL
uniref:Uncharacterized protein n=1 Tax=Rhizophora mucronata TaxID=61149 RepID=A0A2P2NK26_RHIMU